MKKSATMITLICVVVILAAFSFCVLKLTTVTVDVAVLYPTKEQIVTLYDYSGNTNRVWINDIDDIYGNNSVVRIGMSIRRSEYPDKIIETLEHIGITNDYGFGSPKRGQSYNY